LDDFFARFAGKIVRVEIHLAWYSFCYLIRVASTAEKHLDNLLSADGADEFPHGAVDKEEYCEPHLNQPEFG